MQTINRYVIHATSDGKPHTATWDCYSRFEAVQLFMQYHATSPPN